MLIKIANIIEFHPAEEIRNLFYKIDNSLRAQELANSRTIYTNKEIKDKKPEYVLFIDKFSLNVEIKDTNISMYRFNSRMKVYDDHNDRISNDLEKKLFVELGFNKEITDENVFAVTMDQDSNVFIQIDLKDYLLQLMCNKIYDSAKKNANLGKSKIIKELLLVNKEQLLEWKGEVKNIQKQDVYDLLKIIYLSQIENMLTKIKAPDLNENKNYFSFAKNLPRKSPSIFQIIRNQEIGDGRQMKKIKNEDILMEVRALEQEFDLEIKTSNEEISLVEEKDQVPFVDDFSTINLEDKDIEEDWGAIGQKQM